MRFKGGGCKRGGVGEIEPLLKRVEVVEDIGEDKVQEGPQLGKVVLRVGVNNYGVEKQRVDIREGECRSG